MGLLDDFRYFGPALGVRRGLPLLLRKIRKRLGKRRIAAELRRGESDAALLARLGLPADAAERQRRLLELFEPFTSAEWTSPVPPPAAGDASAFPAAGNAADPPAAAVSSARAAAEAVLAGRQRLFGREVEVGWPPRWNWRWDGTDNEAAFREDIRSTWELQRLQGILPLARSGDPVHATRYLETLEDFHRAHPGPDGPAFESALEPGLRLIALAQGIPAVAGSEAWPGHDLVVLRMLDRHARLLAADLSLDKVVRGNHLLGELAGLVVAGHLLPAARDAWWGARDAQALLEVEILSQIHPDGVSVEQSLTYEKFILEFLALAAHAAARRGRPLASAPLERLRAAARHLDAAALPDGTLPRIGDADGGRGASWGEPDPHRWTGTAGRLRALVGPSGNSPGDASKGAPPDEVRIIRFPAGGHAVLRADVAGDVAFLRAGPFGWGPRGPASHSHADWLAPVLAHGGAPLLIDPGVFGYRVGGGLRDAFRTGVAHSSVVPEPPPPPFPDGTFRWRDFRAVSRLLTEAETGPRGIGGEVDFTPAGLSLRWRRVLTYNPIARSWSILDRFSGDHDGPLAWAFRFASGVDLTATATSGVFRATLPSGAVLEVRLDPAGETEVGEEWVAPTYGTRVRAAVLRRRMPGRVDMTETTIVPA